MEIWKDIEGYEGLYQVSNTGRVKRLVGKNCRKERILSAGYNTYGYLKVDLYTGNRAKSKTIHRIMAETFIPNPNNLPCVCHYNDIRDDNRIENLWWGSIEDNNKDRDVKGRTCKGELHWNWGNKK